MESKDETTEKSSDSAESSIINSSDLEEDNMTKSMKERRSLCLFNANSKLRHFCIMASNNRYFENLILVIIFLNSITLAMNRYDDPFNRTRWNQVLNICNIVWTWIFFAEAAVKIIANGFFMSKNAYLRDVLNIMDFVIVVSGLTEFFIEMSTATGNA